MAEFLPADFARDGSLNYQAKLQAAIDQAAKEGVPLVFPPATYMLYKQGLELRSGSTLWMHGARFEMDKHSRGDGQAFVGHDVSGVRLAGGEIVGHNDSWPLGVNIRGIYLSGKLSDIRIADLRIRELSSNGIGIFGEPAVPARDVWVTDVVIDHCSNTYKDYLEERSGPEPESRREDQGLVCFYYVRDFVVRGCRLENSRSDGTHFYYCRQGQIADNRIYSAKMGGYFLETCSDVIGSGNVIRDSGSRGVTIERGSTRCTLENCIVSGSGREGAWLPDCAGLVIVGNIFDRNGRKAGKESAKGGPESHTSNLCIDEDASDPTNTVAEDYLVANNLIYTDPDQRAAIRVLASVSKQIMIKNNLLRGENHKIAIEGEPANSVISQGNEE